MGAFKQDILLVEDNAGDARLVEIMLSELHDVDYNLITAERMSEAVRLIDQHDFQAAIVDMSLPDGDGLENISRLKSSMKNLPIVVLSGNYDEEFALQTVKAGAQDYLVKGNIDHGQLSRALNYAVERKRLQENFVHMAHHDALTGLANRTLFKARLDHAIHNAKRRNEFIALLFMDLDNFKSINDALGHEVGDKLLVEVGKRLTNSVREVDTVGRLGGDEFAIILEGIDHPNNVISVAQKIIGNIMQAIEIETNLLYVGTSIGISLYPDCGVDSATLIRNADSAMYKAKRNGGGQHQFYTEAMNKHAKDELKMEMQLREALSNKQFVLHYQPKYELITGKLTGSEALIRWNHPEKGLLTPDFFIPQLEKNGLINEVGLWVLETACKQHAEWEKQGLDVGKIAVNLSSRQLIQPGFSTTISAILEKTGLKASSLEVELTEGLLMKNTEATMALLVDLRAKGVSIAIDGFGTGFSSFSFLTRFVVDTIKVDRSFIKNATKNSPEAAILAAITQLGKDLNIHIVAEGVESQEQLETLRNFYVDEIQGFYISPPLPADQFGQLTDVILF